MRSLTRFFVVVTGLFLGLFSSACPYLFSVENRPCTVQGECLPGYTCVENLCVTAGAKDLNEACIDSSECVAGSLCVDAYCDDSAQASCEKDEDCNVNAGQSCRHNTCVCDRVCRATCDYPFFDKCQLGEMCWFETDANQGFCQQGNCGETDQGENIGNCLDNEVCLNYNGPGSGLCIPMCDIMAQDACANGTTPEGTLCCANNQNCEHIVKLWGASMNPGNYRGICVDNGTQNEADPCSNDVRDNLFCSRGLFCLPTSNSSASCVRYCNIESPGAAPACGAGQLCINIPGAPAGLPYGYCQTQ